MIKLLDSSKNFYKANLHCHSTLSDGKFTPKELKEMYKKNGYSVLAITDHEHLNDNSSLDDKEFLTITSCEIAIKQFPTESTLKNLDMKVCHLNLYAKEQNNTYNFFYNSVADHFSKPEVRKNLKKPDVDYKRIYGADGINNIIKNANDNGFFVCYNHPRWSLENYSDYSGYNGLWGVEIYNTASNVSGIYEYNPNVFDDFLRDGKKIFATSGDDNHNHRQDSFGTFVMINAKRLDYKTIIDALLKGDFYVSNGPLIYELYIKNDKVKIKCSDAKAISYSTFGRRAKCKVAEAGKLLNEAEFEIKKSDRYFRIDVIDEFNNRANTQSYEV